MGCLQVPGGGAVGGAREGGLQAPGMRGGVWDMEGCVGYVCGWGAWVVRGRLQLRVRVCDCVGWVWVGGWPTPGGLSVP